MFDLKPISREAVPEAILKAERYRLLNEPWQAESICLDVLRVQPGHQPAVRILLLALTDQFGKGVSAARAKDSLQRIDNDYERHYYAGIIAERWADSLLHKGAPGAGFVAYESLREAMAHYEQAEAIRPHGNDEALLRWNTCARLIMRNRELRPRGKEAFEPAFED
ncbi:MAG TPA: hypothetical protein VKS01_02415 [Bryobacteraceae bacterium]|nr:hypothetical protein [Bryobacteraceae bacterium]